MTMPKTITTNILTFINGSITQDMSIEITNYRYDYYYNLTLSVIYQYI